MAKDWHSTAELQKDAAIYGKFVLTLCGVAAWDFLSTLPFDWSIISGKRKWRWPMALYFIARICMILHIFAYAVNLNAISRIPCLQVVWISKVTDAIGTPIASGILLLRTAAVWHQNKKVWIPLVCMLLGQIVLWLQTFRYSRTEWNEQRKACVILATAPNPLLVAVFSYTMAFDFVIMVLCSYRLFKARSTSAISNLLFRDGIVYFAAAFGANLLQSVLGALALNQVMNIFALPFALVVSVIASTAVFRNVFTLYDDFAGGPSSNSRPTTSGQGVIGNTMGARTGTRKMSMSKKNNNTGVDSFALNPVSHAASRDHQAFGLGGIEVTRVVDVNVDIERGGQHYTTSAGKKGTLDDDSDGWPDREDQKSHLPIPHDVDHLKSGNLGTLSTVAILPISLSEQEPMFNASSPLRYKADVEVDLEPEYPMGDREFFINAVQKHISLSVANLTMVADLRPCGAHFLPVLLEAIARFQHEMSTSEEDDIKSEASNPDDSTYKEEWDPLELVQWMLDVYRNMSPRAVEIYSDLMQILEKRLERRWAEIGSSEAPTEVTEAVAERSDDGWDIGHHSTGDLGLSFSRLPPEIVGEIFLHAADVPLMPVTLSHIDRFSRNVAINLPKLWDRISIRLAPRIVELYFERSKAAPLIVDAVLPPLLGYWTPRTSRRMKEFMAAMQPHGRRIQVLKIRQYFVGFVDLSELLDLLTTSSLGEDLKVLEIGETGDQIQEWPEDQLPDFDRWKDSPSAPECIAIYGSCPTIWVLRTISFGRLVRLEIVDNSDLGLRSLLEGLGRSPLLETLKLSNCIITAGQNEQEFPTISLSVLHTLEVIHTGAPGLPFFDHLGPFPKLTTFAMAFVEIDDKRPDTEFTRFMRRHPSIRNVQLDDFFTSTEGWKLVFGCFSLTTHLWLSNCFLNDDNLAILCGSVDDVSLDVLMPNLTHITLDNEWELHSEAISRLVKQRLAWCADRKYIVIQPLQSVVLRGWDDAKMNKDDIDLIRGSVKDFVLETVWGDGTESEASSDSGRDYEYCWSDIDPNELAFEE